MFVAKWFSSSQKAGHSLLSFGSKLILAQRYLMLRTVGVLIPKASIGTVNFNIFINYCVSCRHAGAALPGTAAEAERFAGAADAKSHALRPSTGERTQAHA
jgi:hypothetical protein